MKENTVYITTSNLVRLIWKKTGKEKPYMGKMYDMLPYWYLQFLTKYSDWVDNLLKWKIDSFQWQIEKNEKKSEWIFEWWNKPVYHKDRNCTKLNSSYENYRIPIRLLKKLREENKYLNDKEIEKKWEEKKILFRKWFFENKDLFENNKDLFYKIMLKKWWVSKFDDIVKSDNSWISEFENWTLIDVQEKIDYLLKKRTNFVLHECNIKESKIIWFLGKNFHLFNWKWIDTEGEYKEGSERVFWNIVDDFYKEYKWYKPDINILHSYWFVEMFALLYKYNEMIDDIKKLIIFYINIKNNVGLGFDETLLDNLWFKKCKECFNLN